jgi:hypothetical protein
MRRGRKIATQSAPTAGYDTTMKKPTRKIALRRETLRVLVGIELLAAAGADGVVGANADTGDPIGGCVRPRLVDTGDPVGGCVNG